MADIYTRTEMALGKSGVEKLKKVHIAVFGLGGVGSYAVEALARSGTGTLTLIDNDVYSETNLNRQLYATIKTLGVKKTEAAKDRILEINPAAKVNIVNAFILKGVNDGINFADFDYVLDAIDTVSGKLEIIKRAKAAGVKVISVMGAGNKLDPTAFRVADISATKVCPLAKVMRKLLKEEGITDVKVVYTEEEPLKIREESAEYKGNGIAPSSVSFVPSVAGLIAAGEIIKDIVFDKKV